MPVGIPVLYPEPISGIYPWSVYGVTGIREEPDKREGGVDGSFNRAYKREFNVVTDDARVGCQAVTLAVSRATGIGIGVPYSIGSWDPVAGTGDPWHESDAGSFCNGLKAKVASGDGCRWTVTADFGTWDPRTEENPLEKALEIGWDWVQFEAIADEDRDGNAIVNSAGDYFDPPVVRDDSRPVLTIVRNEPTFDMDYAASFKDSINSKVWFGRPKYTVKCSSITSNIAYSMNVPGDDKFYWPVKYVFHINNDGWDKEVLDQGLRTSDGKPILRSGIPVQSPVLLDGSGGALAAGGEATFLSFGIYPLRDFVDGFKFKGSDPTLP